MRDLADGPRRFVELQRVLPGISTEQLRSRLNRMVADDLLTRKRYREVPPRVEYTLTDKARDLLPVVGALSQWGYRWAWSDPHNGEAVSIMAILRSLCGVPAPPELHGTVLAEVSGDPPERSLMTLNGGCLSLSAQPERRADATISGTTSAWTAALGPESQRGALQISGDAELAHALLDLLAPAHAG